VSFLAEIVGAVLMPVVLLAVGVVTIRALLRLATFAGKDIAVLSRNWLSTGVRCTIAYVALELNLISRIFKWWLEDLPKSIRGDLPPAQLLLVLTLWMLVPVFLVIVAYFLLPVQNWLLGLMRPHPLIVWKTRRRLVAGTFVAFVLSVVLWALGARGPMLFFFLAAAVSLYLVEPSLGLEPSHRSFRRWVIPAAWAFYWGIACVGWRYEWPGLFLVTLPTLLVVGGWLFLAAGAILPLPDADLFPGGQPPERRSGKRKGILNSLRYPVRREPGSLPSFDNDVAWVVDALRQEASYWLLVLRQCSSALLPYWFSLLTYPADSSKTEKAKESLERCVAQHQIPERYVAQHQALAEYIGQRRQTLRCLLTYALGTNYPYYVVIDEKIKYRMEEERTWLTGEERLIKRVEGDSYGSYLSGPGMVLTGCDHAVVISSGTTFKGAKGPGVVFTGFADAPTQAIDLRVHLRAFPVEAWTKDGIAVKVLTFIPFQIDTGKEKPALGKGFPYHASAVFKAVQAQPMVHEGASQMPEDIKHLLWYDMPQLYGERIMRDLISRYEFDELYAPFKLYDDFSQHPRAQIAKALREKLDQELPEMGIRRMGGNIGNMDPVDEEVLGQRIRAWRAEWMREVMQRQARGQSTRLRLVEQARAQAQTDIILDIGNRMRQLRDAGEDTRLDAVLGYFVEVLEQLAGRKELRQLLPGDMDMIIRTLRSVASSSVPILEEGE
jgi:hypothetical protein